MANGRKGQGTNMSEIIDMELERVRRDCIETCEAFEAIGFDMLGDLRTVTDDIEKLLKGDISHLQAKDFWGVYTINALLLSEYLIARFDIDTDTREQIDKIRELIQSRMRAELCLR